LQGKELSFNNIADADAAWECVKRFSAPACVIVQHANPLRRGRGGVSPAGLLVCSANRSNLGIWPHHCVQLPDGQA